MEKNKIVSRIKKLLHLADTSKNSNVEEAAAAAAKAQALIEKHRIEQALLENDVSPEGIAWKLLVDKGKPENWKVFLTGILAKVNGCYTVKSPTYTMDGQLWIVGEPLDIDSCQELYSYIVIELNRFCIAELLNHKVLNKTYPEKAFVDSYYVGAITIVEDRLKKATETARAEAVSTYSQSEAQLVKLKTTLDKLDKKAEVAKDFIKNKFSSVNFTSVSLETKNVDGFKAGQEAAKKLNLDPKRPQLNQEK